MLLSIGLRHIFSGVAAFLVTTSSPECSVAVSNLYLPRLIYPGTYGNYCGPGSPSDTVGPACIPHGRSSDDPIDRVDAACMNHDIDYCSCQSNWMDRQALRSVSSEGPKVPPGISALTATRFLSSPLLARAGVDEEYLACVDRADARLVEEGILIRREAQLSGCRAERSLSDDSKRISESPYSLSARKTPPWLCGADQDPKFTLTRFEKVNLALFLRSLDWDTKKLRSDNPAIQSSSQPETRSEIESELEKEYEFSKDPFCLRREPLGKLATLEERRNEALRVFRRAGESVSDSEAEPQVVNLESDMLKILGRSASF